MSRTSTPFRPSPASVDLAEWLADSSKEVELLTAAYRLLYEDEYALGFLGERLPLIARELLFEAADEPGGQFLSRAVVSADWQEVAGVLGRTWSRGASKSFLESELSRMRVRPPRARRAG